MMEMLAAALFVLMGWGVLAYGFAILRQAQRSKHWPGVQGRIVSSQVHLVEWEDGAAIWPEIEYEYSVNQHSFKSARVSFGRDAGLYLPFAAERFVARYPAGSSVTVYYDPLRPQEAVLDQGAGYGNYAALAFGVIVVVLGMSIGYWFGFRA